jgi:hypothetical protein
MAITEQAQSELALAEDLARLVRLVDDGRIEEARRLAPQLAEKWPESRPIQHPNRVLEPPKVIPSPPGLRGRNLDPERAWLREHAHEYPGCWLAVYGDRLIAADPDLKKVHQAVRTILPDDFALLHHQPAEQP